MMAGKNQAAKVIFPFNDTYNVTIKFLLYFKNGKGIQHEIFTIAKSFNETTNHVKMIENIL